MHIQNKQRLQGNFVRRWLTRIGSFLAMLATIAGILSLLPRLSVAHTGTLEPGDPFSAVFELSNDSLFAISNVHTDCLEFGYDAKRNNRVGRNHGIEDAGTLAAGTKMTLDCHGPVGITPWEGDAHAEISISFTPGYVPFITRNAHFSFVAARASDGSYLWMPLAR